MKKTAIILALCLLAGLLCACGAETQSAKPADSAPAATSAPAPETAKPTVAPTAAPQTPQPTEKPAEETPAETQTPEPRNEKLELAMTFIDKTTEELFNAIGMPEESDYAPSCLGPGEDGNLYYEGFTVYTYRENGKETVRIVE